jgi:arginyl-tRNA synthetase
MFLLMEKRVNKAISEVATRLYGISVPVSAEQPRDSSLGDLSYSVAFRIVKMLKGVGSDY